MNFPAFFYAILITIGLFAENSGTYDPIPILYYPVQNIYRISSLPALKDMLSETAINKPTFLFILFLCGDAKTSSTSLDLQKILLSMDPQVSVLEQIPDCMNKSNLKTIKTRQIPPHYVAIGYEISVTALDSVRQNNLPVKPLQTDVTLGLPIFYNTKESWHERGESYATMHHFNAYNRSFISSTTCDEFKSITVNYKEIIEDLEDIEWLFDEQRQDQRFIYFQIQFKDDIKEESSDKLPPKEYFVPHRMVPMDDFIYDNERMATCISSNVVPIWKSISEGPIKRVEKFIQTLANKLYDHTLTVYTLTYGQMELGSTQVISGTNVAEHVDFRIPREKIYFGTEFHTLPVPKYFLKIVGYSLPFTNTDYVNNRPRYYMVIVIHNDIFSDTGRLCNVEKEPICKQNGWDVTSDDDDDQVIYCCHFTSKRLMTILQDYKFSGEVFNLNEIVLTNEDTNETGKDDLSNETEDTEKEQQSTKSIRRLFPFWGSKRDK